MPTGLSAVGSVLSLPYIPGANYQWTRDGTAISAATSNTYTLTPTDLTHVIACQLLSAGITATSALVTLGSITLSTYNAVINNTFAATLVGSTSGSTYQVTCPDASVQQLQVNNNILTGIFTSLGTKTLTILETRNGATNSPRQSTVQIIVSSTASFDNNLDLSATGDTGFGLYYGVM